MRSLDELIEKDEPGIELVRSWIRDGKNSVEELPVERAAGERALLGLQVTSRSPMGAIALETGGLLVDHGWVRILGGGSLRLPRAIHEWNRMQAGRAERMPGAVLIADDVLGGFFAVNGGGVGAAMFHVYYFAPDSLRWEEVASSYSEWLSAMFSGDLERFYEGARWQDWPAEVAGLAGDRGFSIYPFPSAAGGPIATRARRSIPIEALWALYVGDRPTTPAH